MKKAQRRIMTASSAPRVFLVDDHPIIRQGLTQLLEKDEQYQVVGDAAGASEAIAGIKQNTPDIVIVDLMLSDGGGIELIKDIHASWPEIKILVSSMHNDATYAERAMRAGATGYICKEQPPEQMIDAVNSTLKGRIYLSPDLSNTVLKHALQGTEGLQASPIESLSDREMEVFELLGDGLRTRDISERLSLSVKTIETYRDNIKSKLSLNNSAELMHRAIRWKIQRDG
ncbi:MAG: response regulator transcription factor [Phycisphaeraceae bacterium]|nr:response regulator transcription factor [Phycisphaeraceae bacterium]